MTIYYTTNGQTPTQSDAAIASSGTITSGTVPIQQNLTLKAKAWSGTNSSAVTSAEYNVTGMVSAGVSHAAVLRFDGKVFAWGQQEFGRLGNGQTSSTVVPSPVELQKTGPAGFIDAVEVAAGENHTLILTTSGTLWSVGSNSVGQLGTGTTGGNHSRAVVVPSGTSGILVEQAAAGSDFSLALSTMASGTGKVLSWGEGAQGRLGSNGTADRSTPGFVLGASSGSPPLGNITQITAGKNFGAALHSGGTVYTWGFNGSGQLGQGDTANNERAAQVKEYFGVFNIPALDVVMAVSAGEDHVLAIRSGTSTNTGNSVYNRAVFSWGEQQYGALGNGETSSQAKKYASPVIKQDNTALDNIEMIAAGPSVSLALDANGTVWAWGRNNTGAVGTGTTGNVSKAQTINVTGTFNTEVVWIAAGGVSSSGAYCLALDEEGRLFAWGNNSSGMLGTGTATTVWSPTVSGTMVFTNHIPTGTLSHGGGSYTAPATVNLSVVASDGNGNLAGVRFFQNSTLLITDTTSPYSHSVSGLTTGTYVFGATVFDAVGASGTTNSIQLGIPLPTVSVTGTPSTIMENSGTSATFRITRPAQENLTNPLSVNFTLTGTAINGGDYSTVTPLTATIASGGTTATVAISPINDAYIEGSENVLMTLTTSSTSYNIHTGTATIIITEPLPGWIGKVSGDSQVGAPTTYLDQPLVVEVRSGSGGTLLINAPVLFSVTSGSGGLAATTSGTVTSGTLTVNTGTTGRAQAWYRQGSEMAVTSTITAVSGSSSTVSFTSETAAGLWSHWPFNDGAGTNADEVTGAGGDGTLTNSPVWTGTGVGGFDGQGAISFTGSNGYVTMGSPTGRTLDLGAGSFSLAAWVKYTEVPGTGDVRRIVGKGYSGWGAGYFMGLKGDGKLAAGLGSTSGTQADALLFKTTAAFNDGQWHHVIVTFDRANSKAQIYVDGTACALEKDSGTGGTVTSAEIGFGGLTTLSASGTGAPFTVASFSGTAAFFIGDVDDVQVHRSLLTAGEVTSAYNVTTDGDTMPDRWEWKFLGTLAQGDEGDPDLDGSSNLQEYQNGTDPQDYFNGTLPLLQKQSGDGQIGASGIVLPNPLVVKVMTSGSVPLANAPVAFSISGSYGQVATTGTGTFGSTLNVVTGTSGTASVYLKADGAAGTMNQVQAQVTTGTNSTSVVFTATAGLPPVVTMVSGNNQAGPPEEYLEEPLVVEVRSGTGGTLLIGEPVLFTVASGSGSLAAQFGGTSSSGTYSASTGTDGRAKAFYLQGGGTAVTSTIAVTSGTSPAVNFTERTTLADGLWAHWKFDEGTGTAAADVTALTASGTLVNGVSWDDGFDGRGGVEFDGFSSQGGSNAYVTMGNPSDRSLDFGKGSFSISLWVNFTQVNIPAGNYGRRIISKGHHGWTPGYFVALHGSGQITAGVGSSQLTSPEAILVRTTEEFNDGSWHHVTVVYDAENSTGRIYVDGVARSLLLDSNTGGEIDSQNPTIVNFDGLQYLTATNENIPLTIGSHGTSYDFYEGAVDDVRIYRKALSETDVEALRNLDIDYSGVGDGLPDWWEWQKLGTLDDDGDDDSDGDGKTNLEEYELGSDPGVAPTLSIIGGNEQTGLPGSFAALPLLVEATSGSSTVVNAPLTFTVTGTGGGQIATTNTGTGLSSSVGLVTGTDGRAQVYFKFPETLGTACTIEVMAGSGTITSQVVFSGSTLAIPESGRHLWLKADEGITMDGSNKVSVWTDQSGSSNNASQGTSNAQPTWVASAFNNKPVLRFDGSNDFLNLGSSPSLVSSDFTFFVVASFASNYGSMALLSRDEGPGVSLKKWIYWYHQPTVPGSLDFHIQTGSQFHSSTTYTRKNGQLEILGLTKNGAQYLHFRDGYAFGTATGTGSIPSISADFLIGQAEGSFYLNGDIAEVIVYDRALTAAERQQVEIYLTQKYALENNDTDGDGMSNAYELANGLDPSSDDRFHDLDNDRYPNIYEFTHGTDPGLSSSKPVAGVTVDPAEGADYTNLKDALVAVAAGSQDYPIIELSAGIYSGALNTGLTINPSHRKPLLIGLAADETIFDAESNNNIFTITGDVAVDGICFRNNSVVEPAVSIWGGEFSIANSIFDGNKVSDYWPSAVFVSDSDKALFRNVSIMNNSSQSLFGISLGALYFEYCRTVECDRLYASQNRSEMGSVIHAEAVSSLKIRNSSFINNGFSLAESRYGGAIFATYSGLAIEGSEFVGNFGMEGGAVYIQNGSVPAIVENCFFRNNRSLNGGGIYRESQTLNVAHTTFVGNTAETAGSSIAGSGTLNVLNSILWGTGASEIQGSPPATVRYSLIRGGFSGTGNISSDPALTVDGHLTSTSPARDTGEISSLGWDWDGEGRPQGDDPDMGADEWLDTDGDGMPDWWEQKYGEISTGATGDDDNDSIGNVNEYILGLPPGEWNGAQGIQVLDPIINATGTSTTARVQVFAYKPLQLKLRFYNFYFDVDESTGHLGSHHADLIKEVTQNVPVGINTINWDGVDPATLQLHTNSIVAVEVLSTDLADSANTELYSPIENYVPSQAFISTSYFDSDEANPWRNIPGTLTVGTDGMTPLLAHMPDYQSLVYHMPITKQTVLAEWIPFGPDGRYPEDGGPYDWTYSSDKMTALTLPVNTIIYENQNLLVGAYSIEAYKTVPALGQVVHGKLNVNRAAMLSLTIYDPALNAYPVYYRNPANGQYEPATNLSLASGSHTFEFYAKDYSLVGAGTGPEKLFSDMTGYGENDDRYFRVKFTITDPRTGRTVEKWASCKILP